MISPIVLVSHLVLASRLQTDLPAIALSFASRGLLQMSTKLKSHCVQQLREPKTDTGSRDFLLYLRERIVFQVVGVAIKLTDALGQFLGCHGVLVVHPTEAFFIQVQAFIFVGFRVNRIEATDYRAFHFFQLFQKVRTDGKQIAAGQADDLIHISETGAHYLGFVTEFLVVVVDAGDGRNPRILVWGDLRSTVLLLVPIVDAAYER